VVGKQDILPMGRNYFTTDGQSVHSVGVEPTLGLVTRYYFLSESRYFGSGPLRREDGSAVCSAITGWSEPRKKVKAKVTLQLAVSQSLCLGIEPILGLVTRYYFLSEGCFLKFAVLSFLRRPL
jgi:hypothetical protein